jgi:hypothetical protein
MTRILRSELMVSLVDGLPEVRLAPICPQGILATTKSTTTLDYWAVITSTQQVLHTTRDVVIEGPANDNLPLPLLPATADASSTAQ